MIRRLIERVPVVGRALMKRRQERDRRKILEAYFGEMRREAEVAEQREKAAMEKQQRDQERGP